MAKKDRFDALQYCGYCQRHLHMPWELFRKHLDFCEEKLVEKFEKRHHDIHRHDKSTEWGE